MIAYKEKMLFNLKELFIILQMKKFKGAKALTKDKNVLTVILGGPIKHYSFFIRGVKDFLIK